MRIPISARQIAHLVGLFLLAAGNQCAAGDDKKIVPQGSEQYNPEWRKESGIPPTGQDWPGSVTKYYGQHPDQFNDKQRQIAKVEINGDFNYDGVISYEDPGDHGSFKRTPPGLILGVHEMSKLIIRVTPYRVDFRGDAVISLEVTGINRGTESGEFKSFDDEVSQTSRVKVWRDSSKRVLLLDSHDPDKRRVEWKFDNSRLALGGAITGMNLPFQPYPRTVYIEGIKPHGPYIGDVRLLISCENSDGDPARNGVFKRFRSTWNHLLVTVNPTPAEKEYAVSEALQDVWITPGQRSAQAYDK